MSACAVHVPDRGPGANWARIDALRALEGVGMRLSARERVELDTLLVRERGRDWSDGDRRRYGASPWTVDVLAGNVALGEALGGPAR